MHERGETSPSISSSVSDESDSLEVSSASSQEVDIDNLITSFGFGLYQIRLWLITGAVTLLTILII
jgi:hypothetical protein